MTSKRLLVILRRLGPIVEGLSRVRSVRLKSGDLGKFTGTGTCENYENTTLVTDVEVK